MTNGEIAYLALVVGGFLIFTVTLAAMTWWTHRPARQQKAASAAEHRNVFGGGAGYASHS